jgi:DNA-binding CsgD family transcriptional regulator
MAESLGGDVFRAVRAARRAATLFTELGDRQGLAGVLILTTIPGSVFEIATLVGGSSVAAGVATGEQALALAREIDWRAGEAFLLALLGEVLAAGGEFGKSLTYLRQSIAIAEEIDHRQWMVQARWGLARLYGTMLLAAREREELEQILTLARSINSRIWVSSIAAALASTWLAMGDVDAAEKLLEDIAPNEIPMRTQGQRLLWQARAELALARDRPDDALAIADRLHASAANLIDEGAIPLLARLKASALVARGEHGPAEALLRAAQQTARDEGALPMQRSLHLALAQLLRDQSRTDEAFLEERSAREIGERLAVTIPDHELRERFMVAAGLAADERLAKQPGAQAAPGGLTPREREVAARVAAGCSNREIGEELFVSERTVEAHVANILRKLGVPSRAGIAAWVAQHGGSHPAT